MRVQFIRNATMRIQYGSVSFLTDPLLAPRLTMPSYTGKSQNPLVDLPLPIEKVVSGMEMVLLSHLHSDHFDPVARATLPKDTLLYCQPGDSGRLTEFGFSRVCPIELQLSHKDMTITRVRGSHGRGSVLEEMGTVSGFVLSAPNEPTVYWAGDTVLYEDVYQAIDRFTPEVIITHSSGAVWGTGRDLIVMDSRQTIQVCQYAPGSVVAAIHMEALDHGTVSRKDLAAARSAAGILHGTLLIPEDGEEISFPKKPLSRK